ncbi:hypothetical protein ACYJW8_01575 [Frateuria aurantia]
MSLSIRMMSDTSLKFGESATAPEMRSLCAESSSAVQENTAHDDHSQLNFQIGFASL